jgi:hypothetical protein
VAEILARKRGSWVGVCRRQFWNEVMSKERIYLFDTTLRDGQQTPGIDFSVEDKIAIAQDARRVRHRLCRGRLSRAPIRPTPRFSPEAHQTASFVAFGMTKRAGVSASNDPGVRPAAAGSGGRGLPCRQELGLPRQAWRSAAPTRKTSNHSRVGQGRHRRRQGGDGRLRAFLRRLQGQSRLCARLRQDRLRGRRALGRAVRHQWRHAAFRNGARSSAS